MKNQKKIAQVLRINFTFTSVVLFSRKCPNNKAFFSQSISGEIHQFCVEKCELITTCGEVTVPETHLDVSRSLLSTFSVHMARISVSTLKHNECSVLNWGHFLPDIGTFFRYVDSVIQLEGNAELRPNLQELVSMELILYFMSHQCKQTVVTKVQLLPMLLTVNKNLEWIGKCTVQLFFLPFCYNIIHLPLIPILPDGFMTSNYLDQRCKYKCRHDANRIRNFIPLNRILKKNQDEGIESERLDRCVLLIVVLNGVIDSSLKIGEDRTNFTGKV